MSNLITLSPSAGGTLDGAPQTWVANTNDLTTAVTATGYFSDKSDVMKGDDFVNIITDEDGTAALIRGKIVDTGTVAVPILTLDISESSPSDIDLAEGSVIVGNASNVGTALVAKTLGQYLKGNGTTVVSVTLESVNYIKGSFETGQTATIKMFFPYACTVNRIRSFVSKALAGTDAGTITARNSAAAAMAGGVITIPLSSAVAVEGIANPTTNNTVTADSFIELVTAKATAGGEVDIHVEVTRT